MLYASCEQQWIDIETTWSTLPLCACGIAIDRDQMQP
jgi:hypothetical protein